MRRVIAIAVAGASLGGCSSMPSFSSIGDYFKSTPPAIQVQLESQPSGADAKTSLGPGCKTPCSVSVPAPDTGFSVTFLLPRFEPATVQVNVIRNPDGPAITDPNPVFAELRKAGAASEGDETEVGQEEEAETGRGSCRIAVPRSERATAARQPHRAANSQRIKRADIATLCGLWSPPIMLRLLPKIAA